jgi:hypothetical protein
MRASESNRSLPQKEDLETQIVKSVNDGFGHNKQAYNIFLYKSDPRCIQVCKKGTFVNGWY